MDDGVAEDCVKHQAVVASGVNCATEVAVGGEDIVNAVSDDGDRSTCCTFECFYTEQCQWRCQEYCQKLVPLHVREGGIENIKATHPEHNTKEGIKIDDEYFDNYL